MEGFYTDEFNNSSFLYRLCFRNYENVADTKVTDFHFIHIYSVTSKLTGISILLISMARNVGLD